MSRMPRLARGGKRSRKSKMLGEPEVVSREEYAGMELDSRLELIRSLVPVGPTRRPFKQPTDSPHP